MPNYGNSYMDTNARLGYSSVSKNYGNAYSNKSNLLFQIKDYVSGDDQNFGEIEYMLENERKKFREAKDKYEYDLDNERKMRIEFENKLIKLKD